eukprot:10171209-Lingulodinium_polyedra.AAC.1
MGSFRTVMLEPKGGSGPAAVLARAARTAHRLLLNVDEQQDHCEFRWSRNRRGGRGSQRAPHPSQGR